MRSWDGIFWSSLAQSFKQKNYYLSCQIFILLIIFWEKESFAKQHVLYSACFWFPPFRSNNAIAGLFMFITLDNRSHSIHNNKYLVIWERTNAKFSSGFASFFSESILSYCPLPSFFASFYLILPKKKTTSICMYLCFFQQCSERFQEIEVTLFQRYGILRTLFFFPCLEIQKGGHER